MTALIASGLNLQRHYEILTDLNVDPLIMQAGYNY